MYRISISILSDTAIYIAIISDTNALLFTFSGEMSQVEMWNIVLPESDIRDLAFCNVESVKSSNRVLTWDMESWKITNVTVRDEKLKAFCENDPFENR